MVCFVVTQCAWSILTVFPLHHKSNHLIQTIMEYKLFSQSTMSNKSHVTCKWTVHDLQTKRQHICCYISNNMHNYNKVQNKMINEGPMINQVLRGAYILIWYEIRAIYMNKRITYMIYMYRMSTIHGQKHPISTELLKRYSKFSEMKHLTHGGTRTHDLPIPCRVL